MASATNISPMCSKRLKNELRDLQKKPIYNIDLYPDESNILVWYFLICGTETYGDYNEGRYVGKIQHDPDYPLKPPNLMMLTPSGRFETNKLICLSNTGYHKETWSSAWNMTTTLLGLISIMLDDSTEAQGIGYIKKTKEERQQIAKDSHDWNKNNIRSIYEKFRFVDDKLNAIPIVTNNENNIKKETK